MNFEFKKNGEGARRTVYLHQPPVPHLHPPPPTTHTKKRFCESGVFTMEIFEV